MSADDTVTVAQMIDYVRHRLALEDKPIRLKHLLRNLRSRSALVCAFLALLELIRLQAVLARQDQGLRRDCHQEAHRFRHAYDRNSPGER